MEMSINKTPWILLSNGSLMNFNANEFYPDSNMWIKSQIP